MKKGLGTNYLALLISCLFISHTYAMERPLEKECTTVGKYMEKFETHTARVQHKITGLPRSKGPTGLNQPYFMSGDLWMHWLKNIPHESLYALTLEQFVEKHFKLACTIIGIKKPRNPSNAIDLVTSELKKQLEDMLGKRKTELSAFSKH